MGRAAGLVLLLVLLGTAACGDTSGAGATLRPHLAAVDAAAVADDPQQLTSAVDGLVRAVGDAEAAGDVSAGHADRIRTAAEALLEVAAQADPRAPRRTTEPTSPPPDGDDGDDGEDADDDDEEDDESRPERGGPPDKGKSKGQAKGHDKDD